MELYNYHTTALEDWVTHFYKRLKIIHPRQIKIETIARHYEIFINRKPLPSYHLVNGRFKGIFLDTRVPADIQKEMFFHELCHILRHAGIQGMMPEAFRELQERDARHFTRYAAIPQHMLHFIELDLDDPEIIEHMSDMFQVTPELCEERLLQIKNRIVNKRFVAEPYHTYEL